MGKLKKLAILGGVRAAPVSSPQGALTGLDQRRDWAAQTTPIHKATQLTRGQEFTEKFGCGGEDLVYKCIGSDLCWRGGTNPHCGSAHGRAGCKQAVSFFRPLAAQPAR